jgi:hypothetical protein
MADRETRHRILKPLDPHKNQKLKSARSLDERQEMIDGDKRYN